MTKLTVFILGLLVPQTAKSWKNDEHKIQVYIYSTCTHLLPLVYKYPVSSLSGGTPASSKALFVQFFPSLSVVQTAPNNTKKMKRNEMTRDTYIYIYILKAQRERGERKKKKLVTLYVYLFFKSLTFTGKLYIQKLSFSFFFLCVSRESSAEE